MPDKDLNHKKNSFSCFKTIKTLKLNKNMMNFVMATINKIIIDHHDRLHGIKLSMVPKLVACQHYFHNTPICDLQKHFDSCDEHQIHWDFLIFFS